jgi:hypothetical protein
MRQKGVIRLQRDAAYPADARRNLAPCRMSPPGGDRRHSPDQAGPVILSKLRITNL